MSNASLRLDISGLKRLISRLDDKPAREMIAQIPARKATAALVAQAIADNFAKEGPGWAPLKPETIRRSVGKRMSKQGVPDRMILQKSKLLFRAATTPGFHGSNGTHSASNLFKQEGKNLVYSVDLVYAGIHNRGKPSRGIHKREFMTLRSEWSKRLKEYVSEQMFKVIVSRMIRGGK